jgi:endoglucanase
LLPLLSVTQESSALALHRARVEKSMLANGQAYYSDVLSLFGLGWLEGRYRFEREGRLHLQRSHSCARAR